MWQLVFGAIGFILGLFLWSTIIGRVIEIQQTKKVNLPNNTLLSLLSIFVALAILSAGSYYLNGFVIGAIIGVIAMVFNIGKLKQEVIETIQKKHGW